MNCGRCKEDKSETEFHKNRSRPNGFQAYCKLCNKGTAMAWAKTEKGQASASEWRRQNRTRLNEKARAWREANPDSVKISKKKQYVKRDKAAEVARVLEWQKANPEKVNAKNSRWAKAHPEQRRELVARYRARLKTATVDKVDYLAILERAGDNCYLCNGQITDQVHFDHVVPLVLGGSHSMDNIKPTHPVCNLRKGARKYEN